MEKNYAEYLLRKTKDDYNLIVEDYARTRAYIPEDIKRLGEYAFKGDKVLDSGCANGRLFEVFEGKDIDYFGIDFSEKLIEVAKKRFPAVKFQVADALNLPFPLDFFDKVYSISVVHNIPSKEFRLSYLGGTRRILKPGGLLILRVWDFWRRKIALKLILKYTFLKIIGKSQLDFKDVFVPWKESKDKILVERYFHCFTKRELRNLVKRAGFTKIKKCWRGGRDPRTNIYLIAEK